MYVLVRPFVQVCLFRRGPQDLPPSTLLLALVALAYVLVTTVMVLPYFPILVCALHALLDLAILALYTWLILRLGGHSRRWLQTLIALAGGSTVLSALMLPLLYNAKGGIAPVLALLYLLLAGWLLILYAHIFRVALSARSLGLGMLLALGYLFLSAAILQRLFPDPGTAPVS